MAFREKVEAGEFVLTTEIGPPKGTDTSHMEEVAESIKEKVDAVNVTDNQTSVMRLSPISACRLLLDWGLEPILQATCRDRNRIYLQSDLLSAWVLGIRNVLAMTGDYVTLGDHPEAKPVFDLDSVQLIRTVATLNGGHDLAGNELNGAPDYFVGAVANPGATPPAMHLAKLRRKLEAGAKFIQTQPIYEPESFDDWLAALGDSVPIIAGVIPLRSVGQARYMNQSVPGVEVPDHLVDRLRKAERAIDEGIRIAVELVQALREREGVAGIHIMAPGMERRLPQIIEEAGL